MASINEIGATAFVIAAIREAEAEQPEPLFHDPFAAWFSNDMARTAARGLDAVFPPSTTMVRFRTRYFDRFVERGVRAGARQVVLLGGGFDMRAHRLANADDAEDLFAENRVTFFEVDQKAVIEFKRGLLESRGLEQPPSLLANYLEVDLATELAERGLDPGAPTLIVWEGNTMYLPPESIMPFLNRLAEGIASFRIAFDYFSVDLVERDFEAADVQRLEGIEKAMRATFLTGFPDLAVFETEAPFAVAESGSFAELGHEFGLGAVVDGYPEEWRETLELYRYCALAKG